MATSWSLVVALALRSAARNLDLVGRPVGRIVDFKGGVLGPLF